MLIPKGTQTLRTARLTLRRFTPDDADAMFQTWANDEEVTRYMMWAPHGSPEATRQLLTHWCAAYEDPNTYNWAIEYEDTLIGNISVTRLHQKCEWAELGYCIGRAYWGEGIMSEAAKAVIDFLFAEAGVHRVVISHVAENPASGRVAQKCGLTFEGTKRESFQVSAGRFLDVSDYGILKSEWERHALH